MKNHTAKNRTFVALLSAVLVFSGSIYSLSALAIDAMTAQASKATIDPSKEFNLMLGASLVSKTEKEAQKSQVAVGSNEASVLQIGNVEVRITPSSQSGSPQVMIELLNGRSGEVFRKSVMPLKDNAGLSVELSKPVEQKIAVKVTRI